LDAGDLDPANLRRLIDALSAERHLAEEKFRAVVEAVPNGIVMVDGCGKIALVNRATEALFGYTRQELMGQPVEMLVPPAERPAHPHYRARFMAAPQARPMGSGRDLMGRRKDGTTFPVEIGLSPLETAEGPRVVATVIDISKRKRAEAALAEALEQQKMLMRELSHRVANGFQIISSLLNWQRRAVRDEAAAEALEATARRVNGMALVHRRLYLNENSPGAQDMAAYLDGLCEDLRGAFIADTAACSLAFEGAGGEGISTDKAVAVGLLATELVTNALKYARGAGEAVRIVLRWEDLADGHRLTVSDDGMGLPEDFDPTKSSGLGMLVVRTQLQQLGGELTTDRTPPGACFIATLPPLR